MMVYGFLGSFSSDRGSTSVASAYSTLVIRSNSSAGAASPVMLYNFSNLKRLQSPLSNDNPYLTIDYRVRFCVNRFKFSLSQEIFDNSYIDMTLGLRKRCLMRRITHFMNKYHSLLDASSCQKCIKEQRYLAIFFQISMIVNPFASHETQHSNKHYHQKMTYTTSTNARKYQDLNIKQASPIHK